MGFALPAAIGAAIAAPHRQVVGVIGDGGMIMSGLELITAVREQIRLTVVVFNDAAYGLIRNAQLSSHGESHGTELMSLDFEALAAATGADYRQVGAGGIAAAMAGDERDGSSVRLVEVPLTDSPGLRRVRARGMMRAAARRLSTSKRRAMLARWFRR
jgi:acetolactate synthase-1/2/3 large subunit